MNDIICRPVGIIRTPFQEAEGMPIQPSGAQEFEGRVVVDDSYAEGLKARPRDPGACDRIKGSGGSTCSSMLGWRKNGDESRCLGFRSFRHTS